MGKGLSRKLLSQHKCHRESVLHHCIIGKKYHAVKEPFDRTEGSLFGGKSGRMTHFLPESLKTFPMFLCTPETSRRDHMF